MNFADRLKNVASKFLEIQKDEEATTALTVVPASPSYLPESVPATLGQKEQVPPSKRPALNADHALQMLSALPESLTTRVRRTTLRAALLAKAKELDVTLEEVLADVAWRRSDRLAERDEHREQIDHEVAECHRVVLEAKARIETLAALRQEVETSTEKDVRDLDLLIHLLGKEIYAPEGETEPSEEPVTDAPEASGELPPHLREANVRRLLGLEKSESGEKTLSDKLR